MPVDTMTEAVPVGASEAGADEIFSRGPEGTTESAADSSPPSSEADESLSSEPAPEPTDPNLGDRSRRSGSPSPAAPESVPSGGWRGVLDAAREMGYQFDPAVADDSAALLHLVRQANSSRQADYYAQLGRQLAPQAPQIERYLREQAQPAPRSEWERPEFDPKWASLVTQDEATGAFLGKPGAPPELVEKVNAYVRWADRYQREPEGYIKHVAQTEFDRLFQERFGQVQRQSAEQQAIEQIRSANAGWLYQADGQGNPAYDPRGRPLLSPAGQRYAQHVAAVAKMGVTDPRHQDLLARNLLHSEAAQAAQQQAAQAQAQGRPQTRQAATRPNVNPLGSLPPSQRQATPGATPPTTAGLSLRDALLRELDSEGLEDKDFDVFGSGAD